MENKNTLVVIPTTPQATEHLITNIYVCVGKTLNEAGFGVPSKQLKRIVNITVTEVIAQLLSLEENEEL